MREERQQVMPITGKECFRKKGWRHRGIGIRACLVCPMSKKQQGSLCGQDEEGQSGTKGDCEDDKSQLKWDFSVRAGLDVTALGRGSTGQAHSCDFCGQRSWVGCLIGCSKLAPTDTSLLGPVCQGSGGSGSKVSHIPC